MPTFRIDDRELTVPDGTTVLQAALAHGVEIPHYCYHPGLSIAGNCRICLVEIEKFPKPAIACNTVAAEGMVVHADGPGAAKLRRRVMEYLLANHPLDCPICDQAGECKLQDYAYRFGQPTTRFVEEKEHGPKRRELGPHVLFDWERCIKCTRCIRFCEEVPKTGELAMLLRGVREEIGVFPGKPLDNPYSGNVVDLCPVGALTLREFRFRSRVWFLTDVPSVCPGCARGCSTRLGTFRNEIFRVTPRANQAVNRWWICDEGRLWGDRLQAAEGRRLDGPRVVPPAAAAPSAAREHDGPRVVPPAAATGADPWEKARDAAAEALRAAAGRVRVLADPRASLEETWALALVAKTLGAPVHLASHEDGADDELLIRADRAPNARGAGLVLDALAGGARPVAELEAALAAGEVAALLALGPGLVGPVEDEPPSLEPDALARAAARIVIDAHPSALSGAATALLPATSYGEFDGAYVNFAGRVQHSAAALAPKTDCRPAAATLLDLAARLGANAPVPDALREALSRDVPALAAIDWLDLPAGEGEDVAGADSASRACPATGAATALLAAGVPPAGR